MQAPLYSFYASNSGMGTTAVTIAFAAYVLGLLPTLLMLGGISNKFGRKPPILLALLLSISATGLLVIQPNWTALFIARMLLGVATALVTTSASAYIYDLLDKQAAKFGTLLVAASTSLGFGSGALSTSASLLFTGNTQLPYSYSALMLMAPALMLMLCYLPTKQTISVEAKILTLPLFPINTWHYGIGMMMAWATTGMVIAVIPISLATLGLSQWTGVVVFLSICTGFLAQQFARRLNSDRNLVIGCLTTVLGFGLITWGYHQASITIILLGAGVTSLSSYGFTYVSALFEFTRNTYQDKARSTAGLYIYAYAGFSLPVITSGYVAQRYGEWPAMKAFLTLLIVVTAATWLAKSIAQKLNKQTKYHSE